MRSSAGSPFPSDILCATLGWRDVKLKFLLERPFAVREVTRIIQRRQGGANDSDCRPLCSYAALGLLPTVALAQCGNVRGVMAAVPGVNRELPVQRHDSTFRVNQRTRVVRFLH